MTNKLKKKSFFQLIVDNYEFLVLALPGIIYYIIFHYIPIFGIVLAFKDYKYNLGILGSKWVGFDNFKLFFMSQDAWRITRNTVGYSVVFIILGIVCSIFIALLLNEIKNKITIKSYQTIMILPHFLSWVIVGYITYIFLNPIGGVLNQIIGLFGGEPIEWYAETKYWPPILVYMNLWKKVGMDCIVYYAAILGINQELYDAAKMDGAGKLRQIWNISLPSLIPLISILSILSIGNMFRGDFGLFYQIPRDVGMLYPVTDIIDTYVYRGVRTGDVGVTAAVGFFQSFVGLILVVTANWIVKKVEPENSLF